VVQGANDPRVNKRESETEAADQTVEASSEESVTVPAGKFDAYKVEIVAAEI